MGARLAVALGRVEAVVKRDDAIGAVSDLLRQRPRGREKGKLEG